MMTSISLPTYQERSSDYYLVDVRTPSEFEEAHIHKANLHPLESLNIDEIMQRAQGKQVLLSCLSGARADKAAKQFTAASHSVACLEGSIQGWEAAGLPVVRHTPRGLPLMRQVLLTVGAINLCASLLAMLLSPTWLWLLIGTSTGLIIAGATGFCGLGMLLAKMPWNRAPSTTPTTPTPSCDAGG